MTNLIMATAFILAGCASTEGSKQDWVDISKAPRGETFSSENGAYIFSFDDVVEVYTHRFPGFSGSFVINKSGYIQIPKVGPVYAKNRSAEFLKSAIRIKLKPHIKYPKVEVSTGTLHSYKVTISGAVRYPKEYQFDKQTTLLEGISRAGGALEDVDRVILIRSGKDGKRTRYTAKISALVKGERGLDNFLLERGDLIILDK